jgi:DNA polymerase elongation subunit (family B)
MESLFDRNSQVDEVLFGVTPTERIVAAEPSGNQLMLWIRSEKDEVTLQSVPFSRWMIASEKRDIEGSQRVELKNDGLCWLYEFDSQNAYRMARSSIGDDRKSVIAYPSDIKMALTRTGITLFKGMTFEKVQRMQIDIETTGLYPEESIVLLVAVRDNRGFLDALTGKESDILYQLNDLIQEKDPDIIEGHNIYGFDLPFLMKRAEILGIPLKFGRDESSPRMGQQRNFAIGGNSRPFIPVYIFGRHVVDTYLAVQRFDVAKGALSSYGLKAVARAYGIAEPDRIELPRDEMEHLFREDKKRVIEYASQDVIETGHLAELVCPTDFFQTQMIPDSFGSVSVSGNGEKINSLFIRAYLSRGEAIPIPFDTGSISGGYTELRMAGMLERIVKADVESLYPSLMITEQIKPSTDRLDLFIPTLQELTRRRLEAKGKMQQSAGTEKYYWDGIQNSFKTLINSFYGYLGAANFHFNDPQAAAKVTERGRAIVQQIARWIEDDGGQVIEIDTDGVYFVSPQSVNGEEAERLFIQKIGDKLPAGIRLAFDGRFQSMVSLKTKNYVLRNYTGELNYKGSSLRSRADEPYGREFLERAIVLLFDRKEREIGKLYQKMIDALYRKEIPVEQLCRRERITEKTFQSSNKQRLRDVAAGVSRGEFLHVYERENGQLGLLEKYEENGRDENTQFYVEKLYKFACRLRDAFTGDFDSIAPKPGKRQISTHQESFDF